VAADAVFVTVLAVEPTDPAASVATFVTGAAVWADWELVTGAVACVAVSSTAAVTGWTASVVLSTVEPTPSSTVCPQAGPVRVSAARNAPMAIAGRRSAAAVVIAA
jgi:hypothetical protein